MQFFFVYFDSSCSPLRFWIWMTESGTPEGFPAVSVVKNLPVMEKAQLQSGGFPGEGNSNPLQCPCLENPLGREVWPAVRVRLDSATKQQQGLPE